MRYSDTATIESNEIVLYNLINKVFIISEGSLFEMCNVISFKF